MYNCEKTARRQNKWVSLMICWLIILGGYLLIRMVFLIFGLQLHLAAQGACLVLLPFIFGALYLRKCCKKQKPWFFFTRTPASCRCREADAVFPRRISVRDQPLARYGGYGGNRED